MNSNTGLSKGKKIVIISLLSVFVVFLSVAAILLTMKKDDSRTIMIYMSGNNLETDWQSATAELKGIDPSLIDLNKYHILLYTGGTKKWHNFVDSSENAIYELKETGFEKVASYDQNNMGSPSTLTSFLNYCYENYPAGNYDLLLWDHGAGSYGSISDEYTGDLIKLNEFEEALSNSPFNSKNKLENVIFETCLNGSLEIATVLEPYAKYLVASEEETFGDDKVSELVFLNSLDEYESSYDFAVGFVDAYFDKLEKMGVVFDNVSTYAVIDLSTIPKLNEKLGDLYNKINLDNDYNKIARIRANSYQFAVAADRCYDYDTVDLYEFVQGLEEIDKNSASNIENYILDEVVLYSTVKTYHAHGISTYIPYNSASLAVVKHMNAFKGASLNKDYMDFITKFDNMKSSTSYTYSYRLDKNEVTSNEKREFKLKLTDEQIDNYTTAKYIIFEKKPDGLFMPVYYSSDVTLDDKGYLSTNITDNLIAVVDENTNSKSFFAIGKLESNDNDISQYNAVVALNRLNEEGWPVIENGVMHLTRDKNNNISVSKVLLTTTNPESGLVETGAAVDLDNYTAIDFSNFRYKILDDNGNYTTDWESSKTLYLEEVKKDKYHFETASLDDGDYYCVFIVYDLQNKPNYSSLIKIN